MSEELITRLENWQTVAHSDYDKEEGHLYIEAADRIAALEQKLELQVREKGIILRERDATFALMLERVEKSEAQISRCVLALEPFVTDVFNDNGEITVAMPRISLGHIRIAYWACREARAALAQGQPT